MRTLAAGLQAHLDTGTTTLCQCWRLTLKSGEKLGFTDHDEALSFDGTAFEASAGFTGSEVESSLGLSVDNLEVTGAIESGRLDDDRLRAGDFDHAAIEIWRVNWSNVAQRVLVRQGHLGEVSHSDTGFTVEVRGLAHVLNQPKGRIYQHGCDATLGDARCGVVTTSPGFSGTGVISMQDGALLFLTGLSFPEDWFTRGSAIWLSGAGAGSNLRVKRHRNVAGATRIEFWQVPSFTVSIGDQLRLVAGCDKQFETCKAKFSNAVNFRGFPHMPGNDFVTEFARQGDPDNDGGKRV